MAYKYAKGKVYRGDIYDEDDTQRDTYIDFGGDTTDNYIGLVTSGSTVLAVVDSSVGIGTSSPSSSFALDIPVSASSVRMGRLEMGAWPYSTGYGFVGHSFQDAHGSNKHLKYNILLTANGSISLNSLTGQDMYFRIGTVIKAAIDANGFFGIGPNAAHADYWTPSAQLQISSSDDGMILLCHDAQQNPVLSVTGSGRVGIGTAAPTEKLEVYPDTDISAVIGRAHIGYNGAHPDAATFSHVDLDASTTFALYQGASGLTILNAKAGKPIHFRIGNVDKMHLTTDGELGIGTTTPTSTFEVSGSQAGNLVETAVNLTLNETHFMVSITDEVTGTLPAANGCGGRIYHIFNNAGGESGGSIDIDCAGDDTINGQGTLTIDSTDEGGGNSSVSLVSNGQSGEEGAWYIFGQYTPSES